jgi:8-amino-7-oxononanoate synthase
VVRRHDRAGPWRLQSGQGVRVRMGGRVFVNFASHDYLDLATDPRLARAAAAAAFRYGCGAGGASFQTGSLPPHRALERALAIREGSESAVVFESSLVASTVLIGALAGRRDAIFCDLFNSPDLLDSCYLSGASVTGYRHADLHDLEALLRADASRSRRRLIVTDTLFSDGGDLAPVAEILSLAERFDAFVVADESRATGVLGHRGRGVTDLVPETNSFRHRLYKIGSLSMAFGSQGGFVSGPRSLIRQIAKDHRLATSGSLFVPAAAAARRAIALADAEPDRRRRVLALAERLRWLLQSRGFTTGPASSQIVAVTVGSSRGTTRASQRLEVMGLLVPALCPPYVPQGTARLRISLTAGHTDVEIERLVESLGAIRSALFV